MPATTAPPRPAATGSSSVDHRQGTVGAARLEIGEQLVQAGPRTRVAL